MNLRIDTLDEAERATLTAAIAAVISAGITLLFIAVAVATEDIFGGIIDAWALLDVAILLGLAYGVYRKSRICGVGLLAFYLVNQVYIRLETGFVGGLVLALVFTYFFVQGARGAFAYHRLKAGEAPAATALG